jgi:putative hydrolase of HD superfamily
MQDSRNEILDQLPEEVKALLEFETLKEVERQNPLGRSARKERVAEHSWHLALAVVLLADFSREPVDVMKATLLAVVHDIAEAFVGDTFAFGSSVLGQHEREEAAMRAFAAASDSAATKRLVEFWQEYEAQETPEARFVKGLDAFLPIVLNFMNVKESSWIEHGVRSEQVRQRLTRVADSIGTLAKLNENMIDRAHIEGYLK